MVKRESVVKILPLKVKYLGLVIDRHLTWKEHITSKRRTLNQRLRELYRLVCPRSPLSLHLKLLLYKTFLRPIWSYGIQLFGSAKSTNIKNIQVFQSKFLRLITGAPFLQLITRCTTTLNYLSGLRKITIHFLFRKIA